MSLTVWWWPAGLEEAEFDVPVPYSRTGPDPIILALAEKLSVPSNTWVKVFATGDELDVRYRWP